MNPSSVEILATALFGCAILHTFSTKRFETLASHYSEGTIGENFFHILGEVEVVFGLWAGVLIVGIAIIEGADRAVHYVEGLNFTEPAFVFAIMVIAATRPIIRFATWLIAKLARVLPLDNDYAFYIVALIVGPLLGSFITEPAAMTVTALILRERYFRANISRRFRYATLGLLFVNISIGGTLTHFAAPPVLMVAGKWGWGIGHMMGSFGYKAAIAIILNTTFVSFFFRRELQGIVRHEPEGDERDDRDVPWWLVFLHLAFLAALVVLAHHVVLFLGVFLFFLGVVSVTEEYQDEVQLREALLVGFFLAGLVTLGGLQSWWLDPLLRSLDTVPLYLGAAALTAVTDNAALTYLGAQVPALSEASRYALVAGAVVGGGLTVIANAPNPAGYGILRGSFPKGAISLFGLMLAALGPTFVALACFWFLPSF